MTETGATGRYRTEAARTIAQRIVAETLHEHDSQPLNGAGRLSDRRDPRAAGPSERASELPDPGPPISELPRPDLGPPADEGDPTVPVVRPHLVLPVRGSRVALVPGDPVEGYGQAYLPYRDRPDAAGQRRTHMLVDQAFASPYRDANPDPYARSGPTQALPRATATQTVAWAGLGLLWVAAAASFGPLMMNALADSVEFVPPDVWETQDVTGESVEPGPAPLERPPLTP